MENIGEFHSFLEVQTSVMPGNVHKQKEVVNNGAGLSPLAVKSTEGTERRGRFVTVLRLNMQV